METAIAQRVRCLNKIKKTHVKNLHSPYYFRIFDTCKTSFPRRGLQGTQGCARRLPDGCRTAHVRGTKKSIKLSGIRHGSFPHFPSTRERKSTDIPKVQNRYSLN